MRGPGVVKLTPRTRARARRTSWQGAWGLSGTFSCAVQKSKGEMCAGVVEVAAPPLPARFTRADAQVLWKNDLFPLVGEGAQAPRARYPASSLIHRRSIHGA